MISNCLLDFLQIVPEKKIQLYTIWGNSLITHWKVQNINHH